MTLQAGIADHVFHSVHLQTAPTQRDGASIPSDSLLLHARHHLWGPSATSLRGALHRHVAIFRMEII